MKQFLDKDFLLSTEMAKTLYHDYAENMPILDYHCHINPQEICEDRKFENITQVWLGGDHYKWRSDAFLTVLMRNTLPATAQTEKNSRHGLRQCLS